jgi:hypothetical protein
MIIGEGSALVGVKLARHPATLNGLFETLVKGARIGRQIISRVRHHPGMIVQDGAEMSGHRLLLAGHAQKGSRGKIHHPQLIDPGRFKGLGRTADGLTHQIPTRALIQRLTLQRPINGADRRQFGIGFFALPVEHFDRDGWIGFDLFQNVTFLFRG